MSSSYVWVQLHYKGKGEEGNPIKIKPIPEDVADLAEAVKAKLKLDVGLHLIFVYAPTTNNTRAKVPYTPGKKLLEVIDELKDTALPTSDEHPLIVEAPAPQQKQPIWSHGLPPRSPETKHGRSGTAPPSVGKAAPRETQPRKSPSSEEGKLEGLGHASFDNNTCMQCTSTPAAVTLLEILEKAVKKQQQGGPDVFDDAAEYVLEARHRMASQKLPRDIGQNERFFTGAMANAINSVLEGGYCVLHQACLGAGATHSDLSATRIKKNSRPTTLMVGEGKWNASDLRDDTRGQIFNELLRHRAIDRQGEEQTNNGPILLLAFDKNQVEIDLAFPSTKDGKLETDKVVEFSDPMETKRETFWTVRILRVSIRDTDGSKKLPIVLRFLSSALKELDSWSEQGRVQQKMPLGLNEEDKTAIVEQYCGENVTIIVGGSGSKFVYKEYCYHLRQACPVMMPLLEIEETNKRQPPTDELLKQLGPPYSEWKVHKGPFGTFVLRYPFIEGDSYNPTVPGWQQILQYIKAMHEIGFIHGDLLPRNVLFGTAGDGYVIDFDLSRRAGATYVRGYNHMDFQEFRHKEAKEGKKMTKEHDLHSLREMSKYFFDLGPLDVSTRNLDELIDLFRHKNPGISPRAEFKRETNGEASGSPVRKEF